MIDSFASNKTTIHIKIQVKYLINKYGEVVQPPINQTKDYGLLNLFSKIV